jgi:hypothetical protein
MHIQLSPREGPKNEGVQEMDKPISNICKQRNIKRSDFIYYEKHV